MKLISLPTILLAAVLLAACSPRATSATSDSTASRAPEAAATADQDLPRQSAQMASGEPVDSGSLGDVEVNSRTTNGELSTDRDNPPADHSESERGSEDTDEAGQTPHRQGHDEVEPCFRFAGPRVVILMIGDGMGLEQVHAGRLANDGALSFEEFPATGAMTTRSADNEVTDSAASATAMATGRKVDNYVVSQQTPGSGVDQETILEAYQRCGRRVGMVTTSRVTHATPASFGAHHSTRWEEPLIFEDYLTEQKIDLIVGGGLRGVDPSQILAAGFVLIRSAADFLALTTPLTTPTMVLIGNSHLPYVADEPQDGEGLAELSAKALDLLDDGQSAVFLMIEGARIDHAGHNNDFDRMWPEVTGFNRAIAAVAARYAGDDDYLLFVTADHETGGLHDVRRNAETGVLEGSWTTGHHTATPVGYYAIGDVPEAPPAVIDNTDVYDILRGEWPAE